MDPQQRYFQTLLKDLIHRRFPTGGMLVTPIRHQKSIPLGIDCPRLSICLTGQAQYTTLTPNGQTLVTLKPGEMIYASPFYVMLPYAPARYTSLGIVFQQQFTRFVIARKRVLANQNPLHEVIHLFHAPATIDSAGQHLCRSLDETACLAERGSFSTMLMQALLIHARDLLLAAPPPSSQGKAYFTWQAACHYVQEHLHETLSRENVATFLKLHPNHISRLFNHFAGQTFSDYVRDRRLSNAQELLRDPQMNISEISYACGFTDPNYFARCFRRRFGRSPGQSRKSLRRFTNQQSNTKT